MLEGWNFMSYEKVTCQNLNLWVMKFPWMAFLSLLPWKLFEMNDFMDQNKFTSHEKTQVYF